MKLINIINPAVNIGDLAVICLADDVILLRQDAVYLATRNDIVWPTARVYALDSDIAIRQLTVQPDITALSAQQWLQLSIDASQVLLWQS
ncbi:DsrH/TusB family sulfur metabolism protein [Rheinheimera sp.]|uniref:DsrH/TusB family sulfur metabolism protein n=1 Tax=Rheinheimera sp. TaxID=1869214 RepID=UPI0027347406|nr:DsrH/TusB family sulfur metabolism protein [Rheinheimera sp.]MDP2713218.1 DsrH/TusB family sulfur metabolism protein [Rheinheimera sp.]